MLQTPEPLPAEMGWRYWVPRVASAILVPVLILAIAEVTLPLTGVGFSTQLLVPCTLKGQPAACYNLFFPAPFFPPGMIKTPQAYAIPVEKPKSTFRIFVLGESAAMGDPDPAYAFSRYLEVMLRERFPSTKFEVVNTGSVAINSHVLLPIARDLANQRPDVFIIYSGNNEVVGPYGPGTALAASGMNLQVIRSSILFRSMRIGQLVTKLGTQKKEWGGMEMFLDKQVPANSPLMGPTYNNFEHNLRDTVAAARNSGATVLVSTVATNQRDCGPFASMHREGLSSADLASWSQFVQEGADQEDAKAYEEALKAYRSAAKIDDQFAELEFRIARTLWKQGDYQEAKEHFARARDLDSLRFRADSEINNINRAVAASGAGVKLLDAEAILSQESPNGIIGNEVMFDHVHLTPRGNYLLARTAFLQIASQLPDEAGYSTQEIDVPSQVECERLLALTKHDRSRITSEMLQRLQRAPFTNQIDHSDQVLRLMIDADASSENPDETVAEYQWAIDKQPDDRILHYNFGLFLFDHNREASAQQLRMSQPWDGFPVFAPDGTQLE
jgi:tetratricopeptide (TPR) repeat protein